jgi:Flp pilus assembly protein TadG
MTRNPAMRLVNCLNLFRSLLRNRAGNVAMLSALVMFALLGVTGVAIDFSRAEASRSSAQNALDSAALAVAQRQSTGGATDSELSQLAKDVFAANVSPSSPATCSLSSLTRNITDGWVLLKFGCELKTTFGNMVGLDKINFNVVSKTVYGGGNVEAALVLDITGSMKDQKIADLKTAATDMINTVVKDKQTPYYSKVAIVPYSIGVNFGAYAANVRGTINNGTCTNPGCQFYQFSNESPFCNKKCSFTAEHPSKNINIFGISTCVSERKGSDAYTDAGPSGVNNRVGYNYAVSTNPCPSAQITPLTSNKTTLLNEISALSATGSTAGHIGVAWGWYMLSPNWGSLWPSSAPAAYGTKNVSKVVVLMSDGMFNTVYCNGVIAKDAKSGSGNDYDHINCDNENGKTASDQAKLLCENMKKKNIIIYTVGFDLDSIKDPTDKAEATSVLSSCATSASHFKLASDGAALKEAFKAIATEINHLRVSE